MQPKYIIFLMSLNKVWNRQFAKLIFFAIHVLDVGLYENFVRSTPPPPPA